MDSSNCENKFKRKEKETTKKRNNNHIISDEMDLKRATTMAKYFVNETTNIFRGK